VIADPPSEAGAVHDRVTVVLPGVPETPVGAPASDRGVTAREAPESVPVPAAFVARTLKVYEVPLVRPVMVWVVAAELKTRSLWATMPM